MIVSDEVVQMGFIITLITGVIAITTFILAQHKEEIWEEIRKKLK